MDSERGVSNPNPTGAEAGLPPPPPPPPLLPHRRQIIGGRAATAAVAAGLVIGGISGGYVLTRAATATPSPTATGAATPCVHGHSGSGSAAHAKDFEQVAAVIGISAAQLQTELRGGKTIAAVAAEHHVAVSVVISSLAADENTEVDQRVASGEITAAQGAEEKTRITERITAAVNGTWPAGHGFGHWKGPGFGPPPGDGTPTN